MQIMDSDLGRTHQSDSQPAEECGQLSGVRQLLKCSSAPAGGHTAAGVAMSLGNLHPRLHVHPGQRLKDVPECGQVRDMSSCITDLHCRFQHAAAAHHWYQCMC